MKIILTFMVAVTTATSLAQSNSSSASFDLLSAPPGGGGGVITGGSVSGDIRIGDGAAGPVSNVTTAGVQEKPNYIGQLFDVTVLTVSAAPASVNEGATRQLSATATMDDLTMLEVAGAAVQWSVVLGPLTGIDAAGLATADVVFQDTAATAQGTYQGVDGQLGLTVLDVDPDNFGTYAGDGLGDAWQVNFFGPPPNADAAPGANPDADPYDNEFEFLTGYDPTDGLDYFRLEVIDRTGATATLELSKIIPGTRYRLQRSKDLAQTDPWTEIANFTTPTEALDHPVTDPDATDPLNFYRIAPEPE